MPSIYDENTNQPATSNFVGNDIGETLTNAGTFVLGSAVNAVTGTVESLSAIGSLATGGDGSGIDIDEQAMFDSIGLGDSYANVAPAAEFGGFVASMFVGGLGGVKAANLLAKTARIGKASKGMRGIEKVAELAGLRAPMFRKQLIVEAANQALQGAVAYEKAVPKGKLLAQVLKEGVLDTAAFEVGMWATTNQSTDYNPESLDPIDALASNFQNNPWSIALGVPLSAGFFYMESAGAVKKLINAGQSRANSVVNAAISHIPVVESKRFDMGTKVASIFRDMNAAEQQAMDAAASIKSPIGTVTDVNIGVAEKEMQSRLGIVLRKTVSENVLNAQGDEIAYLADNYIGLLREVQKTPVQGEAAINLGRNVDGNVVGVSKISMLDAAKDVYKPLAQESYVDLVGIGKGYKTADQLAEVSAWQLQRDGSISYQKATPVGSNMPGEVVMYDDFHKMNAEQQAVSFDRVLNSMTAREVLQLGSDATGTNIVGGLQGAPVRVIKSIMTRAKNMLGQVDEDYIALAQSQTLLKKLQQTGKRLIQKSGKNKLSPEDAALIQRDLVTDFNMLTEDMKSAFMGGKGSALEKELSQFGPDFDVDLLIDFESKLSSYVNKEIDRLYDPSELFGRVISQLTENADSFKKIDGQVYNILTGNDLLQPLFSKTRTGIRNLNTNELTIASGVRPVLSDLGRIEYKFAPKTGKAVAQAGNRTIPIAETFNSWNELFSVEDSIAASAHYAFAEKHAQKIVDSYVSGQVLSEFNIPHMDAIVKILNTSTPEKQFEILSRVSVGEGKLFDTAKDFEAYVVGRKKEALNHILDDSTKGLAKDVNDIEGIQKLREHRQTWTMDNIQKYVGMGDNLETEFFPMVDALSKERTSIQGYWNSPHHVKEYRNVGQLVEDDAIAKSMIDASINAANAARGIQLGQALNGSQFEQMLLQAPSVETVNASLDSATTTGGAGLLSFAWSDSAIGKITGYLGERFGAFRGQLERTRKQQMQGLWRNIESAEQKAEAFALIQKTQAGRFGDDSYRGVSVDLPNTPEIKKKLIDLGVITDETAPIPTLRFFANSKFADAVSDQAFALRALEINNLDSVGAIRMNESVFQFMDELQKSHKARIARGNSIRAASGKSQFIASGDYYFPPPDLSTHPYVNWLSIAKAPEEGGGRELQMIYGADEANLQANVRKAVSQLEDQGRRVEVRNRNELRDWAKAAKGNAWDYTMDFGDRYAKVDASARGILQGIQPKFDNKLIEDIIQWDLEQEVSLMRDYVKENYANMFNSLDQLDVLSRSASESVVGAKDKAISPFKQMIREALNLPGDTADWWSQIGETLDKTLSRGAYALERTVAGIYESKNLDSGVSLLQANQAIEKYNLRLPYDSVEGLLKAHYRMEDRVGTNLIRKFNSIAAAVQLRLDAANSIVQTVSTPIRLMPMLQTLQREILEGSSRPGALSDLVSHAIPDGSRMKTVSPLKVMQQATMDYFTAEGRQFMKDMKSIGVIKGTLIDHAEVLDVFTKLPKDGTVDTVKHFISEGIKNTTDKMSRVLGSNWSEEFSRFVAARSAYRVAEAAAKDGLIAADEIMLHVQDVVRKLHGTSIAASRPEMFKGTIGSGMMLFQSYQFQMIQQLMRSIGSGARAESATLVAAQAAVFGGQSLPGFNWFNEKNAEANHFTKDLHSAVYQRFGEDMGNFIIYGAASAPLAPFGIDTGLALYSRGDTNPRFVTLVPTSPQDFPAVNMATKAFSSFYGTAKQMLATGMDGQALVEGAVLSGMNRPLKMLGQQFAVGGELTQAGNVVAPVSQDLWGWNTFAHALGARTMNEAIVRDALFRNDSYKMLQQEKLESLGKSVKTAMRGNEINQEIMTDFAEGYFKAKGNLNNFNKWMQQQVVNASPLAIEKLYKGTQSPKYQQLMERMGAQQESYLSNQLRLASQAAEAADVPIEQTEAIQNAPTVLDASGWIQ